MRSNIALSYIAMLTIVGFFLWVIRNIVRSMRQNGLDVPVIPVSEPLTDPDKKTVNLPVHIFLNQDDDIPLPGRLVSLDPAGGFMQSSACLKTGQEIALYVDVAAEQQVQLTARVTWAREGRDGRNAAQLVFTNLGADKKKELYRFASSPV